MPKLETNNLCVEYLSKRESKSILALDGMSFTVEKGKIAAIVGPSGCGKTTLLKVIAGLLPVNSGEIWLDDSPIRGPGADRSMVFQSPSLLPWRTVLRNITYGLELQGVKVRDAEGTATYLINLVGLSGFEQSYPHELSGGMKQRVNLARALATDPQLLLLDEPLASLDAQTRESMQVELQRILFETSKTAVFVTHQTSEAIYLGDIVIVSSARPGVVREVICVDFPRPRPPSIKMHPGFVEIDKYIWSLIREESGGSINSI